MIDACCMSNFAGAYDQVQQRCRCLQPGGITSFVGAVSHMYEQTLQDSSSSSPSCWTLAHKHTHTHTHRHSLSHTCLHWLLKDVQPKSKSPEVVKLVVPQSPHMRSRISCGILAHWPNPPTAYSIGYSVRFILTFEGIGFKAQFGPRNEREPSVSFLDRVARLDA